MGKISLPPGFRFHPTDVELVWYYLKRKIMGKPFRFEAVSEVELYKFSPWDLPEKSCLRSNDLEWYFFCPRDRKYSQGSRTNRTTDTGYWKTTGRDRSIVHNSQTVGMKRTLIFHLGKPPQGSRTNWVMYEFRLESKDLINAGYIQDAYVLCKIFQKSGPGPRNGEQYGAPFREEDWEDADIENAGSFPIFSSGENPPFFSPVPLQSIAPDDGGPSSAPVVGESSCVQSSFEVGELSYAQSDFEVGEPSSMQELYGAGYLPSMQGFCEVGEPSYMPEPYADGLSLEQLEAFLNSSPPDSSNLRGNISDSAFSVDNFITMPELEADYMYRDLADLSAQPLADPTDGTVSYDNIGPDLHFGPAFDEFVKEHYVELSDFDFADGGKGVDSGNINPDDVVNSYLASEPQQMEFSDNQFPLSSEDDCLP